MLKKKMKRMWDCHNAMRQHVLYVLVCSNMSLHEYVLLLFSFIVWNDTMKMYRFGIHTLDFDRNVIEYK